MSALSKEEFAAEVMKMTNVPEEFKPQAYYDPDGDCIEFFVSDDNFYAERIDELVTVYYSQENKGEIVGSLIKGISRVCKKILEKYPGFMIEIKDGKINLEHLFQAQLWGKEHLGDEVLVLTYQKLIEKARLSNLEPELELEVA